MFSRIAKILSIISFVSIAICLFIIAITPPATGYEISIYAPYPLYFWFLFITSIACGICIMVYQAFTGIKSGWWLVGFSTIVLANLILLLLPFFRGYAFYGGGDGLTHFGMVKDIIATGKFGENNFYPASHVLTTFIFYITGLSPRLLVSITPVIFYILYISGVYLLATVIAKTAGQLILITVLATPLSFGFYTVGFYPSQFSLSFVPLILFFFYKAYLHSGYLVQYRVLFLLILLLLPLIHPYSAMMMILVFIVFGVSLKISQLLEARKITTKRKSSSNSALQVIAIPTLILLTVTFAWYSSFPAFRATTTMFANWLGYGEGITAFTMYQSWGQQLQITIGNFAYLLFVNYGHNLLYAIFASIAILIIIKKTRSSGRNSTSQEEIFFSLLFITLAVIFFLFLLAPLPIKEPMREFMWAVMVCIFLNGIIFHNWVAKKPGNSKRRAGASFKETLATSAVFILVLFSAIIGIFSTHTSPIIQSPSHHITQMHWNGMEWFFKHMNPVLETYSLGGGAERWGPAILGYEAFLREPVSILKMLPHLGYDSAETLERLYNSRAYIIIDKSGRVPHEELWPNVIFSPGDFKKLDSDRRVNRIYVNEDIEISQYLSKKESLKNN